jgi:predicted PurR-regulated permease PerM
LQELLEAVRRDPSALGTALSEMATRLFGEMGGVMGGVGRNLAKMGFAVLALFFLYLSGEDLLRQVRLAARGLLGARVEGYVEAIGATTRAVVYGLVLTALAQGVMAGIGYAAVGFSAPLLLGALTVLTALIPFGTPFVWGSLALWLVLTGETGKGLALFLWGAVVVSWVDNLVRPLVISSATRIPFLLVMFGVLGGVAAFGLIGLFLGPVVLAVALAVWREWLEEQGETGPAS